MSAPLDRYRKQTLFAGIGEAGQALLSDGRAVVIGCGALGAVIAESLARAGVGHLRLVDRDFVELSNLQRQVLYDEDDVAQRLPKATAAAEKLKRINSTITIEPRIEDVTATNILELVRDADVILDGTDNFETRYLINDAAVETGIPWVHAGCVGATGQVMSIVPGQTPCLRCLMPEIPPAGSTETCDTAGVLNAAVQIVASLQVVDALKILTGQRDLIRSALLVVDVWEGSFRTMNLELLMAQAHCPCCQGKDRYWLHGEGSSHSTVLCGRNSVQVAPAHRVKLSLPQLAGSLKRSGSVRSNPFLVVFQPEGAEQEITIFADGRAIISGTEDLAVARSLYARYIGQ